MFWSPSFLARLFVEDLLVVLGAVLRLLGCVLGLPLGLDWIADVGGMITVCVRVFMRSVLGVVGVMCAVFMRMVGGGYRVSLIGCCCLRTTGVAAAGVLGPLPSAVSSGCG